MTMHSFPRRDEAHALVLEMTKDGFGPTPISKALNSHGFLTSRGTPFSVQRTSQLVREVSPGSRAVREVKRHRRGVSRGLRKLYAEAANDPQAARVHAAYLREREGGAHPLEAIDRAVAVA